MTKLLNSMSPVSSLFSVYILAILFNTCLSDFEAVAKSAKAGLLGE